MSIYTVATGNTINAADLNQLVNILQQPSGGTESGYYYINGWGNASADNSGYGVSTRSQGATPVSVAINTSVQTASGFNAPSTNSLTANGFHVFTSTTSAQTNAFVGGVYTVQY